jgi:lysophospholipase L1-like esterase
MPFRRDLALVLSAAALTLLGLPILPGRGVEPAPCQFERWQSEIDRFTQSDREHPPRPGGLLFVGSSSIRLWKLDDWFGELGAINRGFGGSQICDSVHYFEQLVIPHAPRVAVLYAGDNDIAAGKQPAQVHHDFRQFVARLHKSLPSTRLVYIAVKPSLARWHLAPAMRELNALIAKDCAADKQMHFLDVWQPMLNEQGTPRKELFVEDGLHLNEQGYALWTKLLTPTLQDAPGNPQR